jgi:hypothetical protein
MPSSPRFGSSPPATAFDRTLAGVIAPERRNICGRSWFSLGIDNGNDQTRETTMKLLTIALAGALALSSTFALAQSSSGGAGGSSTTGGSAATGSTTGSSVNGVQTGNPGSTTTGRATGPNSTANPSGNTLAPNGSPSGSTLQPTGPGSGLKR